MMIANSTVPKLGTTETGGVKFVPILVSITYDLLLGYNLYPTL